MKVIDFHTHVFPDSIAPRALASIASKNEYSVPFLDGTAGGLLASMDRNGIEKSVICNIATKPTQFEPILEFCRKIRSERLIPLPSVHPFDPQAGEKIRAIAKEGFKGIKLHPYFQDFYVDDEAVFDVYEAVSETGIMLVMHCGYDISFEHTRNADPSRIVKIVDKFPKMKFVATHLGAWKLWDEVEELLAGKENVWLETSFALEYMEAADAIRIIEKHDAGRILFGSDSPWQKQEVAIQLLNELDIERHNNNLIFYDNAIELLESV